MMQTYHPLLGKLIMMDPLCTFYCGTTRDSHLHPFPVVNCVEHRFALLLSKEWLGDVRYDAHHSRLLLVIVDVEDSLFDTGA